MAAFNSEYVLDGFDLTEENQRWFVMEGTSIPELGAPSLLSGLLPLFYSVAASRIPLATSSRSALSGLATG